MMASTMETATPLPKPARYSYHALCRAARRNVVPDAIDYVLTHGRHTRRTGVTFYFLGWRDMPKADRVRSWAARLEGTVVLVGPDGEIITVYRNRQAWHTIQRKLKYRIAEYLPHHGAQQVTGCACSMNDVAIA